MRRFRSQKIIASILFLATVAVATGLLHLCDCADDHAGDFESRHCESRCLNCAQHLFVNTPDVVAEAVPSPPNVPPFFAHNDSLPNTLLAYDIFHPPRPALGLV